MEFQNFISIDMCCSINKIQKAIIASLITTSAVAWIVSINQPDMMVSFFMDRQEKYLMPVCVPENVHGAKVLEIMWNSIAVDRTSCHQDISKLSVF